MRRLRPLGALVPATVVPAPTLTMTLTTTAPRRAVSQSLVRPVVPYQPPGPSWPWVVGGALSAVAGIGTALVARRGRGRGRGGGGGNALPWIAGGLGAAGAVVGGVVAAKRAAARAALPRTTATSLLVPLRVQLEGGRPAGAGAEKPKFRLVVAPSVPVPWSEGYRAVRKMARSFGHEIAEQVAVHDRPSARGADVTRAARRAEPFLRRLLLAEWSRVGPEGAGPFVRTRRRDNGELVGRTAVRPPDGFEHTDWHVCGNSVQGTSPQWQDAVARACAGRAGDTLEISYNYDWLIDGRGEFSGFGPYGLADDRLLLPGRSIGNDWRQRKLSTWYRTPETDSDLHDYTEATRFWLLDSICYHLAPYVSFEIEAGSERALADARLELITEVALNTALSLAEQLPPGTGADNAATLRSRLVDAIEASWLLTLSPTEMSVFSTIVAALRTISAMVATVYTAGAAAASVAAQVTSAASSVQGLVSLARELSVETVAAIVGNGAESALAQVFPDVNGYLSAVAFPADLFDSALAGARAQVNVEIDGAVSVVRQAVGV